MSRDLTLFVWLFAATFLVGTIMPIALVVKHGWPRGSRWIQNYLSTTLFLLAFFPAAVGVLGVTYDQHEDIRPHGTAALVSYTLLALLIGMALLVTWRDFVTLDAIPFLLNEGEGKAGRVWELEPKLREDEGKLYDSADCREFTQLVRPFGSLAGLRARGNWLTIPLFLVNAAGAVCVVLLAFGLALASKIGVGGRLDQDAARQLTVVFVIFLLWFPLRIYTNWYQFAPYRQSTLSAQKLLLALAIVAVLVAFLSWHSFQPGISRTVLVTLAASVTPIVFGALKAPWPIVRNVAAAVASGFQSVDFSYFLMIAVALLVVTGVVASDFVLPPQLPTVQQAGTPDSASATSPHTR